jgi:hypothetical protein
MCTQWWRGDDGELHLCGEERGHSGECRCITCGTVFSETLRMI